MSARDDTICAVATPPGVGGIGVVRVSGPDARAVCTGLTGALPPPRHAALARFRDAAGEIIDSGIVLFFPAPASFTGEDVLELQGHGGSQVLAQVLQRVRELGARDAHPGEFSRRAFLNDKIDLVQAEAIADLVESGTEAAARAAQRSLEGEFSRRIQQLQDTLTGLRVFVEAAIDFPDEEIDFLAESDVLDRCAAALDQLDAVLADARQGRLLRDGIVLAIIGRPNAGKSSLLNALSGADRAIVTEIPGTTRDVLREQIDLDGVPVHVADTAGIRETEDRIEAEGVRRAREALASADVALLVEDAAAPAPRDDDLRDEVPPGVVCLRVRNKVDLLPDGRAPVTGSGESDAVWISARTGHGIDVLRRRIRAAVGAAEPAGGAFSARRRHVDALLRARGHVADGAKALRADGSGELLAEELRLAQGALGEITGEMLPDDLLGRIFASFCIGK